MLKNKQETATVCTVLTNHNMKNVALKKILFLVSVILYFSGCQSDCPLDCPAKCFPISFILLEDGINILGKKPFQIDSIHVVSTPSNPEAPPLFEIDKKKFKLVVCQGVEYKLYLNDSTAIEITARLDTFSVDNCCVYYSVNSIHFNGDELCSDQDQCASGVFELN